MDRLSEAEVMYRRVIQGRKKVLGPEYPDTLMSMNGLATVLSNQGKHEEAEETSQCVLELRGSVLGKDHPDTLISMDNLASMYSTQAQWKEAEDLFVKVMKTRKRMFGEEFPDTLISINNLASLYWSQGRSKNTALNGYLEVVKLLLRIDNLDIISEDTDVRVALSLLVGSQHSEMINKLLEMDDVDFNSKDADTRMFLPLATIRVYRAIIKQKQDQMNHELWANPATSVIASDSGYGSMRPSSLEPTNGENRTQKPVQHLVEEEVEQYFPEEVGYTPSFSNESMVGPDTSFAFELLLEVIRDDAVLKPLFNIVLEKKGREIAIASLKIFLEGYCVLLRDGNPNINHSKAIQFLRHRALHFAEAVYKPVDTVKFSENSDNAEARLKAKEEKRLRTERMALLFFQNTQSVTDESSGSNALEIEDAAGRTDAMETESVKSQETSDGAGSESNSEWLELPGSVQEVKAFLTQGEPMELFRRCFTNFVNDESLDDWNMRVKHRVEISSANQATISRELSTITAPKTDLKPDWINASELGSSFFSLVTRQDLLGPLISAALRSEKSHEKFISKYGALLSQYCANLLKYSLSDYQRLAANMLSRRISNIISETMRYYLDIPDSSRLVQTLNHFSSKIEEQTLQENVKKSKGTNENNRADSQEMITSSNEGDLENKVLFSTVKDFLISGTAFGTLRLAFRRIIEQAPMDFACQEVFYGIRSTQHDDIVSASFKVYWDLREYIKKELDLTQKLGPVFTASGGARDAVTMTCASYIDWLWPDSNIKLLKAIDLTLQNGSYRTLFSGFMQPILIIDRIDKVGLIYRRGTIR